MDKSNTAKISEEKLYDKYKFPKGANIMILYQLLAGMASYMFVLIFPIYMTSIVKYSNSTSTTIYHVRSVISYCMNILGALLADGYIGRIKTFMIFYPIDTLLFIGVLVFSIYHYFKLLITMVLLAAFLGGICGAATRAFVADQIPQDNTVMLSSFLHIIYLMNNLGVIIVGIIGPILHKDIYCFNNECYQINFSITIILMISVIILIAVGLIFKAFVLFPPTKNIISETACCIFYGLKTRIKEGKHPDGHWMDHAEKKYDYKFVYDCKILLGLCFFLLAHPIFFTVFEQMTSIWTLQARYMNGMVTETFTLKADQIQTLNPIFVVILIPICELAIYPFLEKVHIQVPYRIAAGHFFTAIACVFMVIIQIFVNFAIFHALAKNEVKIKLMNLNPNVVFLNDSFTNIDIPSYEMRELSFKSDTAETMLTIISNNQVHKVDIGQWKGIFSTGAIHTNSNSTIETVFSEIDFQKDGGYGNVRAIDMNILPDDVEIILGGDVGINTNFIIPKSKNEFGSYVKCGIGRYKIYLNSKNSSTIMKRILLNPGESIVIAPILVNQEFKVFSFTEYKHNLPSIFWQFLPYLFVTLGEVFFNVNTGIFLYSEAPLSMKSVLLSVQYFCIALGDVFIIILNHIFDARNMLAFHILCACLVSISGIITIILARIYLKDKIVRENTLTSRSKDN